MRKRISQREARRLLARVTELENEKSIRANRHRMAYPGGVALVSGVKLSDFGTGVLCGAARSGRALIAKYDEASREVTIFGVEQ